jgi:ankyrin repeat protein
VIDNVIDSVEPGSPAVRRLWLLILTCLVAVLALACSPDPASSSGVVEPASALREAAGRGDIPAVRALLEQGSPVDARDGQGATALIRAAYGNHLDVAALLVQAGADVDLADDSRQSAYLIATSEVGDDPRLLELTLAAGADINAKDSYDGTG